MSAAEFLYTTILRPRPLRMMANATLRAISREKKRILSALVFLNPADPVISGAASLGLYENDELSFFARECKPQFTVLDIGANVGIYTAVAMSVVGNAGRVISVEPDPEALVYLRKTISANLGFGAKVDVIEAGAGSRGGTANLYKSASNKGDNRLYANPNADRYDTVRVVSLDDELSRLKIDKVDLIKIDVQGFEFSALSGMKETIRRSEDLTILSEFWPRGLGEAGSSAEEYLYWLKELGFSILRLGRGGVCEPVANIPELIARLPGRKYANIVARKKRQVTGCGT